MPPPAPLEHRYGPHPAQVADLHRPGGPARGVVVTVHGGYWRARYDRTLEHAVALDLVARGWAVWNVDYRAVGEGPATGGGWPRTFEDVAAAVDLLADVAPAHGLDALPLAAVGHSAGGALALWLAGRHHLPAGAPGAGPRVRPGAVVAQAAVCDLRSGARARLGDGAVEDLLGPQPAAGADLPPEHPYRVASPAALLPLGVPVLAVTGAQDDTVPVEQSRDFAALAAAAGDRVDLVVLPGEGHFGHLDPAAPSWRAAAGWLDAWLAGVSGSRTAG